MANPSRLCVLFVLCWAWSRLGRVETTDPQCPWLHHKNSCYKFEMSPTSARNDAQQNCLAYGAELVSVDDLQEYEFLKNQLLQQESKPRQWYINGKQTSQGVWINDVDNKTILKFIENLFLPGQNSAKNKGDYVAFTYSVNTEKWVLEKVFGDLYFPYICEMYVKEQNIAVKDNFNQYGYNVDDSLNVPRGPFFIKQPSNVLYDSYRISTTNDITLNCRAGGYPTPTYEWFKEEDDNEDKSSKVDPLKNSRYTLSGGSFIINAPKEDEDKGRYYCKATNSFGSIISETIELSFLFIDEFSLQHIIENGTRNLGRAIFCDPPRYFPSVDYLWFKDSFPNFVQENQRVFISNDGHLYFSALQEIDAGNYSCSVKSKKSNSGKTGPLFPLHVSTQSDDVYDWPIFPNNFPKVFPKEPIVGHEVRLECVAYTFPMPSYSWTRKGAPLPKSAYLMNYKRVLIIPQVRLEDHGEYTCYVSSGYYSSEKSIFLTIQAEPMFTVPLSDKQIESQFNLTWTCIAFGVPKVTYKWFKNGELLDVEKLQSDDKKRYSIQNNVLNIIYVDMKRDSGMYQCQAHNKFKKYYSSAQLRVLSHSPSFKINTLRSEIYATQGRNVTIECGYNAVPKPLLIWTKDEYIINHDTRYIVSENGDLLINPVEKEDEGDYSCIAHNVHGIRQNKKRLIVKRKLGFFIPLKPQIRSMIKKDVLLRCQAVSNGHLEIAYTWTRNDMPLRDSNSVLSGHVHINGEELLIHNVTLEDSGDYKCIAHTIIDEISSVTTLSIDGPPSPPGGVNVHINQKSAKLHWTDGAANGSPITHYMIYARTQWNNTWLKISSGIVAKNIENNRKEALIENVLQPWSTYEFKIAAGNEFGFSEASLPSLQVNTPPDHPYKAPKNVTGGGGIMGQLTIMWEKLKPQDQNGPGIYYKVYYQRYGYESNYQYKILKNFGDIGKAVVDIDPEFYFTIYAVKVQAFNDLGAGPITDFEIIYSGENKPQGVPHNVVSVAYNSTAISVSWTPIELKREAMGGRIIGYRLKYWKNDGSEREENAMYHFSRGAQTLKTLILGLEPDTKYNIKVMALTSAGAGPESETSIERTYFRAPQTPPSGVTIERLTQDSIRVTFRYTGFESIYGYKVRIWEQDQDISTAKDTIINVGSKLEVDISNLIRNKLYNLRVLAYSKGGDGKMSTPMNTFKLL